MQYSTFLNPVKGTALFVYNSSYQVRQPKDIFQSDNAMPDMARNEVHQRAKAIVTTIAWVVFWGLFMASGVGSAERLLKSKERDYVVDKETRQGFLVQLLHFLWQTGKSSYQPVWPVCLSIHLLLVQH